MGHRPLIIVFILLHSNCLHRIESVSNVTNTITNCTVSDLHSINDRYKNITAPHGLSYRFLRCNFNTIPDAFFTNVTHLQTLEFCSSTILSIRSDALNGLTELEVLRIIDNPNFVQLDPWSVHNLSKLIELDLHENGIKRLDAAALHHYPNLKQLNLRRNSIVNIPDDFLSVSFNLDTLNLAENSLQRIESNTFKSLVRLTDLNLAFNRIDYIDIYAFMRTTQLKVLHLNGNKIKRIEAFFNLGRLEWLNLSENALNAYSFEEDAFKQNIQLHHLDMSYNSMYSILPNTFHGLHSLQVSRSHLQLDTHQFLWD